MPEIKLTNVDTVVSQSNKTLSIEAAADLTKNLSGATHGDSLIYASGEWTTGAVATSGGAGGAVLGDTGIEITSQVISNQTDYFYEFGGTPTIELNIINAADKQVLAYDSSSGKWVNSTSAGGGGGTTLSDVGISFDVQAGDNVWEVDSTPSTTAFSVAKSEEPDGSINFDFPVNSNP
jgi:hypothetical protein